MPSFPNLARLITPLSDWQLQFYDFVVDVSPKSLVAFSGPVRGGRLSKTCWRWQREQVSRRGSASARAKPMCEHAEQRAATKAIAKPAVVLRPDYRPGKRLANANVLID